MWCQEKKRTWERAVTLIQERHAGEGDREESLVNRLTKRNSLYVGADDRDRRVQLLSPSSRRGYPSCDAEGAGEARCVTGGPSDSGQASKSAGIQGSRARPHISSSGHPSSHGAPSPRVPGGPRRASFIFTLDN
ncbi:hypothetical protein MRX96_030961 [Rhipicephalus microplus]